MHALTQPFSYTVSRVFLQFILRMDPNKRPSIEELCFATWTLIEPAIKPRPIYAAPLYTTEKCFTCEDFRHSTRQDEPRRGVDKRKKVMINPLIHE